MRSARASSSGVTGPVGLFGVRTRMSLGKESRFKSRGEIRVQAATRTNKKRWNMEGNHSLKLDFVCA